jgi:glycosyltransferase involved in cell wall biosynthesis
MPASSNFVLVTTSFPIRNDGSEAAGSFVADLAEELSIYCDVRVVAPGAIAAREQWTKKIEIIRYAAPAKPLSTLKPWWPQDFRWIIRVLRGGLAATRNAIDDDSMHVLGLWGLPCGEWARRGTSELNIGYSVWMLGSDVWSLGRMPILRGMLARVMRRAARAYADGYRLAEQAELIGHVPVAFLPSTRQISVHDLASRCPGQRTRLLFLGRWHVNKGIDLLLDALALLNDDDWSLIQDVEIQGGGPLETRVRESITAMQSKGLPIIAGGFLAKEQAEAAILRSDWVVIPSRIESIPLIFSDAMKLGRPIVATPVGDLPELVSLYKCGLLAKAVTAIDIAEALRVAIRGNEIDYVKATRNAAEAFSISAIAKRLLSAASPEA